MAVPESQLSTVNTQALAQLMHATRQSAVATLAASIVTAANRPHSIGEVMEIFQSVYFSMYAETGSGAYQAWVKTKQASLDKVRT